MPMVSAHVQDLKGEVRAKLLKSGIEANRPGGHRCNRTRSSLTATFISEY